MMVSSIARFPFFSKVQFNKREPGVCAELSKVFRLVSAIVRTARSPSRAVAGRISQGVRYRSHMEWG